MKSLSENSIQAGIQKSILFHLVIVASFFVKNFLLPSEDIVFERSIKVDIVDLPDKIKPGVKPEPKPVKAKEVKKPKPKPKPKPKKAKSSKKVNLKKTKSTQESALERLKALNKIEKSAKNVRQQKSAIEKLRKGNVVSAGTSLTGTNRIQYDRYIGDLDNHVKSYWEIPRWMQTSDDLKTLVQIKIDSQGFVTSRKILQSSGNTNFDTLVLNTLKKASPFPSPPGKFSAILSAKGFTLEFKP